MEHWNICKKSFFKPQNFFLLFYSVFSSLGFGYASGGLIIIAEIIYAKLTRSTSQKTGSSLAIVLLLLSLSATLVAVTILMINTFYDPQYDPCLLSNELCEWEYQKETMDMEHWNICKI